MEQRKTPATAAPRPGGVDDERSVDMDQPTNPPPEHQTADPIPQLCCHCGELTREPVLVGEVHTASGAGASIFACPKDAPLFGENAVRLQGRAS